MANSLYLHTKSGYIEIHNLTNVDDLRKRSADFLWEREKELYAWVGESTYEGFRKKISKEFNKVEGVRQALENFKKSNLIINLGLPSQLQFVEQRIEFTLTSEMSQDIVAIMKEQLGITTEDFVVSVKGEPLRLGFDYNEPYIKAFLNAYFNEKRFVDGTNTNKKRSDKTNPLRYANKAFRKLASEEKIEDITINKKPVNKNFSIDANEAKKDFGYKKEDIEKAIKNNTPEGQQLRKAILNSRDIIYNTLFKFMNGIPDLETAFNRAWNNKLGGSDIDEVLSNFSFFSKGDNLNAGVSGAVQELYTAIIAEYINIKLGEGINRKVADILGDIIKGGEQPKTDVQILNRIGIQVKAYSMDRAITKMSTNIHPRALGESLAPYGNANIADEIVQMVFNSSDGDYNSIADDLEPALAQLMNMTTSEQLTDSICFYLVDGQFLVPGSQILETLRATHYQIKIRTSFDTQNDEYFEQEDYVRDDGSTGPNFLSYFNGQHVKGFTKENVTDENKQTFNLLMNKAISIDVKFDYNFMGDSKYLIF